MTRRVCNSTPKSQSDLSSHSHNATVGRCAIAHPTRSDVEHAWAEELMNRHKLFEAGKIRTVSYEEVFGITPA